MVIAIIKDDDNQLSFDGYTNIVCGDWCSDDQFQVYGSFQNEGKQYVVPSSSVVKTFKVSDLQLVYKGQDLFITDKNSRCIISGKPIAGDFVISGRAYPHFQKVI